MLLRVTVGWHILYEGLWKLDAQNFSSEGYLGMASGPFAHFFQYDVLQDFEGRQRVTPEWNFVKMDDYHARFVSQFKLEGAAKDVADRALATRKSNVQQFVDNPENRKLFADHAAAWDKLNAQKEAVEQHKAGAPFERQRQWEATQKLRNEARPWLKWIADQHAGLQSDLQKTLPPSQREANITFSIPEKLRDPDLLVTYACIAIGLCLMVGLFTRLAAFGGAVFLALIVLAKLEWPGYYAPPAHPAQGHSLIINKEFIEMMCCVVLMSLPVGRWAGLDFILHGLFVRPFSKQ